jgi:hypothetical protein
MKRLAPALVLTLLLPACGDEDSPTQPGADHTGTVIFTPVATVPPRPVPTPVPDSPPTQVLRFKPSPPSGPTPFVFAVNQCLSQSSLPGYPLDFSYDFGDGTQKGGRGICRSQHTYTRGGSFKGVFCVTDREPGHRVCTNITVSPS